MLAKIPGLILVRSTSTRLPQKCFLPLGESSVLEHIIFRARHFGFDPILCTTNDKADDVIDEISKKNGCKIFRGSTEDKIRRLRDACNAFQLDTFITIDADDPFFDPDGDRELFSVLAKGFDFVMHPDNYYCGSLGIAVRKFLLDHAIENMDTSHSEMMWKYFENQEGIRFTPFPSPKAQMARIRLTLDYPEDYHLISFVHRVLGPFATRGDIEKLFNDNPDLYKINWFRQDSWKKGQSGVA